MEKGENCWDLNNSVQSVHNIIPIDITYFNTIAY